MDKQVDRPEGDTRLCPDQHTSERGDGTGSLRGGGGTLRSKSRRPRPLGPYVRYALQLRTHHISIISSPSLAATRAAWLCAVQGPTQHAQILLALASLSDCTLHYGDTACVFRTLANERALHRSHDMLVVATKKGEGGPCWL